MKLRRSWIGAACRASLAVAVCFAVGACSDSGDPPRGLLHEPVGERVTRLLLQGGGPLSAVDAEGETRMASIFDVGGLGEVCVPDSSGKVSRVLRLGLRSAKPARVSKVSITFPGQTPVESGVGLQWADLEVPITRAAAACATIELKGRPGSQAAISTPSIRIDGPRRPWVILYVIDTLRFDFTPFAESVDPAMRAKLAPALEELAADGIVYRNAFSTSSWTRPTVATLLTGLGPSFHRVYDRQDRLPAAVSRLPVWLASQGWATHALSSNPNVLPLWGFMPGFDRFVDVGSEDWTTNSDFGDLTQHVLRAFEENADAPLFLYVHDNEPHSPYRPEPRYREMFDAPPVGSRGELPERTADAERMSQSRALYSASIRSMSDRLHTTIEALKRLGRYDDALIVAVGDHGEEFGEHGGVLHGRTLYQEQLHVPLVIKVPAGSAAPGEVLGAVSTESLAATMLHFLDIATPDSIDALRLPLAGEERQSGPVYSELLLDGARSEVAVSWPWKYMRDDGTRERIFDLEADPKETRDLSAEYPDVLESLRSSVDRRRAIASSGLAIRCIAGGEPATAHYEVELGGEELPVIETGGLDPADKVAIAPGAVKLLLLLRPAVEPTQPFARFRASVAALAQTDRDELRIKRVEADSILLRALGEGPFVPLLGPTGAVLKASGEPIALSELTVSVAPADPELAERPACLVYYLELPSEATRDSELDPQLRARLEALGYLH